jgi:hypothetical protein
MLMAQTVFVNSVLKKIIQLVAYAAVALPAQIFVAQTQVQQNFHDQAVNLIQQQIGLDTNVPNERNPEGLGIRFQKIQENQQPTGRSFQYRLLMPGAPEKEKYTLTVWRIGADMKDTPAPVYTNAKGLLMWHLPTAEQEEKDSLDKADEVEIDLKAARGEPIRYMLRSQDGRLFFPGTIVPFPIESKDGNCRLEVRLAFPEGQAMLVYADGLPPGAQVPMHMASEGQTHDSKMKANAQGHAVSVVSPAVPGTNAGVAKISVALPGCSVAVDVPWGDGSYRPL